MKEAAIFCGGRGTRMRSFKKEAKPLVKVNNKEIIRYIIEFYQKFGIRKIYLLTGYKHEDFKKKLFIKNDKSIEIIYSGLRSTTLQRLKKLKDIIQEDNFFLTYGDSLANHNLKKSFNSHILSKKIFSMTVNKYYFPYGTVEKSLNKVRFKEKQDLFINSGFYVVSKEIFKILDKFKSLENDLIPALATRNNLNISSYVKSWYPMDNKYDYLRLNDNLQKK